MKKIKFTFKSFIKEVYLFKSRSRIIIIVLICLVILSGLTINARSVSNEVVATGEAKIVNENISQAKDEALQKAFLETVRKTIGTYVNKQVLMQNQQVLKNNIYSKVEGYVTDYQILNESRVDGYYRVEISARATNKLWEELERLGFILRTQVGNPRCLLLLNDSSQGNSFSFFKSRLRSILTQTGITLIDREAINNIRDIIDSQQVTNNESVISVGQSYQADIVVYGDLYTEAISQRELTSSTLNIIKAHSDLRVFTTSDGHMIASVNNSEKAYAETNSVAQNLALEKVSISSGGKLVRRIISALNKTTAQMNIKLEVLDVQAYSSLPNLENILTNINGIKRKYFRNYSQNRAIYDLKVSQDANNIAFKLSEADKNINILEVLPNRIVIKLVN